MQLELLHAPVQQRRDVKCIFSDGQADLVYPPELLEPAASAPEHSEQLAVEAQLAVADIAVAVAVPGNVRDWRNRPSVAGKGGFGCFSGPHPRRRLPDDPGLRRSPGQRPRCERVALCRRGGGGGFRRGAAGRGLSAASRRSSTRSGRRQSTRLPRAIGGRAPVVGQIGCDPVWRARPARPGAAGGWSAGAFRVACLRITARLKRPSVKVHE